MSNEDDDIEEEFEEQIVDATDLQFDNAEPENLLNDADFQGVIENVANLQFNSPSTNKTQQHQQQQQHNHSYNNNNKNNHYNNNHNTNRWNNNNNRDRGYGNRRGYGGRTRGRERGRGRGRGRDRFQIQSRPYQQHRNNNNNNNNNRYNYNSSSLHPQSGRGRSFIHNGQRQPSMNNTNNNNNTNKTISDSDISSKCAYATMCINNQEYLSGAFTLAWSLMTCGSKADRVIIIDQEMDTKYGELIDLTGLFDQKFVIPRKLEYIAIQKRWRKYAESGIYDWINTSFNKYYCFQLNQYSRIVMLDADQLCLKNPDELFKLQCPAGICSFYSELNNTLQYKHHGYKVPNADIRRSYERQWGIRGCLFMIEPSTNTFNDIIQRLDYEQRENGGIGDNKCFLGADEKFLTKYYMTTTGDLADSDWTHIHSKFSRLSYIDKTSLAEDPYFLHFCTFKPWKSPGSDKWIHEQWEDIAIWLFASASTSLYITKRLQPQFDQSYIAKIANIMSPDAQFYADVLKQEWSKKYLDPALVTNAKPTEVLLNLYHIMANSYKEIQLKKQNQTKDLKKKIQETMNLNHDEKPINNDNDSNEQKENIEINKVSSFWSFDYSKHLLLSALLSKKKEKIPDRVIWQFWDKSEDEIPENIKFCINSVRRNNAGWKHILITPENVWNYLSEREVPSNLLLFERACHISDVIRVALLAKYGGIYCDSTVICFANCRYMDFNFIWDELLMEKGYDFVGFKYEDQKTKWKNDEKFCCWFMATKKDNGLLYSWLNKINILMENKTSNNQLDIIDLLYSNKHTPFKKYVALGPGILDELFIEYTHYHTNFKYKLFDPRDFALLDQFFNYEQLWYLNSNQEWNFKEWFDTKSPHFIKLFCADKGTKELYKILKQKYNYSQDKQVKLQDIMDSGLILSDIFQFV